MKVLLTGASGFVGSHILDCLCSQHVPTVVLLRETSNRQFIEAHLSDVEVRRGSIGDIESLSHALRDVTHVVHCAGLTRATRPADYYQGNYLGTRNLVEAVNRQQGRIQRLLYISSLAAIGPTGQGRPARERDDPHPVSDYGRSKLQGEIEVREHCEAEYVILRPPAVYGPRDNGFISLFRTVGIHMLPKFVGGIKMMSLVYVQDLAAAVLACLTHAATAGKAYFVSSPEVTSPYDFGRKIAIGMGVRVVPLPIPTICLWPVCAVSEAMARFTGKPTLLNRQKYAELSAPGWVCDSTQLREETGVVCEISLDAGIALTIAWYRKSGWL